MGILDLRTGLARLSCAGASGMSSKHCRDRSQGRELRLLMPANCTFFTRSNARSDVRGTVCRRPFANHEASRMGLPFSSPSSLQSSLLKRPPADASPSKIYHEANCLIGKLPAGSAALVSSGRQAMIERARPSPKLVSCMQLEQGPRGFSSSNISFLSIHAYPSQAGGRSTRLCSGLPSYRLVR